MNTNSKRLGLYLAIMLLLTSVATTLRTIASLTALDYGSGFFNDKSLITAADIIITLTVLGMFSYLFVASRIKLHANFSTGATYIPTGVLGVASAFFGAKVLSYAMSIEQSHIFPREMAYMQGAAKVIGIITAVLAFLSIAHHFFNAFIVESKTEIRAYFAIATIMFLALYSMLIYLDPTLSIGESTKVLRLIAFLFASIFFLYEARISLGREMWRIYTTFGLIAASLCAYASVPAIVTYYAKDALISAASSKSLVTIEEYIVLFALFLFIVARLYITITLHEAKENALINALANYAKEREEKVKESSERHQEAFASKQLSIFDLYGGEVEVNVEEEEVVVDEEPAEEEPKEPTISDEAIYEAIFGTMPDGEGAPKESVATEPDDTRIPEEIANELLQSLEDAMNEAKNDQKETDI
jgi:hypothetical protein